MGVVPRRGRRSIGTGFVCPCNTPKNCPIVRWPDRRNLTRWLSPTTNRRASPPPPLWDLCASVFPSSGRILKHRETEGTEERGQSTQAFPAQRRESIGRGSHRCGSAGASPSRGTGDVPVLSSLPGLVRICARLPPVETGGYFLPSLAGLRRFTLSWRCGRERRNEPHAEGRRTRRKTVGRVSLLRGLRVSLSSVRIQRRTAAP